MRRMPPRERENDQAGTGNIWGGMRNLISVVYVSRSVLFRLVHQDLAPGLLIAPFVSWTSEMRPIVTAKHTPSPARRE